MTLAKLSDRSTYHEVEVVGAKEPSTLFRPLGHFTGDAPSFCDCLGVRIAPYKCPNLLSVPILPNFIGVLVYLLFPTNLLFCRHFTLCPKKSIPLDV